MFKNVKFRLFFWVSIVAILFVVIPAMVFSQGGELENAQKKVQQTPNDAETHFELGIIYNNLSFYQDAIFSYKEAIRIKPDFLDAHFNLGLTYEKLGYYQDAISSYKEALKINPKDTIVHTNLDHLEEQMANDEGIRWAEKARLLRENMKKQQAIVDLKETDRLAHEKKLLEEWKINKEKKIILVPGRLTSWKGQELLIEAINLVKIELGYEAFYVVILGSDQGRSLYKKKLIQLTEQYRLTNQIKFIDHCEDMALAYQVSDIVISPSIEPEAFGRVAVESQSMEKLIIASNIGGSNETIVNEKTGFLFDSGDTNSLSKKIVRSITMDETSLKLIGKEGRKNIIKKFNVEKMCFSTYSEYKKLLN